MRKVKLFCLSLITGLLISSPSLGIVTASAQEIVSETSNIQEKGSEYIKYIDGDTIFYKENTKMSDVFDVYGTEEANSFKKLGEEKSIRASNTYYYDSKTLEPGHQYNLICLIEYNVNAPVEILFKTDKSCDMVAGLRYTSNGNIYASQKVSCTAHLMNKVKIPLEKGKLVDGFILNINGVNVELTSVGVSFQ